MKKYKKPIYLKGDYSKRLNFDDPSNFMPMPVPRTDEPYRLNLNDVVETDEDELTFHMVGDTGSFKNLAFQKQIAAEIIKNAHDGKPTDFLYHLGDVVYNFGEASEYPQQFFEPYEEYPGPIFAIAGNHDADINPDAPVPYKSLDPFMDVFCTAERAPISFSQGSKRVSLNQPYVYWTLESSLANFIGLYGNVAKFGLIDEEQRAWFIEELKKAKVEQDEKALIIAIHQSPYSSDTNHGSSLYMINFLETAFAEAGVIPDLVFSGHVHNYQRFHKTYLDPINNDIKVVPYIVAGAGGYAILHAVAEIDDPMVSDDYEGFDSVSLENSCQDKHGFMKMNIVRKSTGLEIKGDYYAIDYKKGSNDLETYLYDSFELCLDRFGELTA